MKKIFLGLLLFISIQSFAQVDGNYNYSIGVRAFNMMQLPKILQQSNTEDYTSSSLNCGIIRFNDNQISFRISGNYLKKKDYTFTNKCDNCETATGALTDYAIKVGFEKNFNYSIVQPYFALDLGFRANSFNGNMTSQNSPTTTPPYAVLASKNGLVIAPVLGVKVNIIKQLSLYVESNIDFMYSYERQETILNDAAHTRTFNKYNKFEGLVQPISLGLQLHLVGKN